jgi:4-amino-4-deoxy-L-arabinose transferase-like glycosyltransferase
MAKSSRKKRRGGPASRQQEHRSEPFSILGRKQSFARGERKIVALVFLLALALRLVFFFVNKAGNPLFYHPVLDSLFHHRWAEEILSGSFWGSEVFFRAPLYPYFLALLYKVSGSSIAFAVLCQHVIGALSVVLVYLLAREFFVARVAILASAMAALYWPLIYFEGSLLIVTLIVFLDLLALLLLSVSVRRQNLGWFLVAGLVLGLSATARPSILILVPVLPLALFLSRRAEDPAGRIRSWHKQTAAVLAGLIVVVTPVLLRNYTVGRDFVPIASQAGVNFFIGNNPLSNGSQAVVPGAPADLEGTFRGAIELAERDVGRSMKPSEVSDYYFKKGLDFVFGSPAESASLTLKKFYFFWAGVERSNNQYIQFFWRHFGLGRVPLAGFWLIGPLALMGGVVLWRRRRELSLFYLFVASYMVGVVAFFVNARFRLPVAPVLMIFAAYAACYLFYTFRNHGATLLRALGVLAACVVFVNYDFVKFRGVRALDEAVSWYELGNAYLATDKDHSALQAFERARGIQERYPTQGYMQISDIVDYNLGILYWEKGLYSRAIDALERIQRNEPAAASTRHILADSYFNVGRLQEALASYSRIVDGSAGDMGGLLGMGKVYKKLGQTEKVQEIVGRLRSLYPGDRRLAAELRALGLDGQRTGE